MWLEGADVIGCVDEYSDIDIWIDFEDEHENRVMRVVEEILSELGELDYKHVTKNSHPKIRQRIYHLKNSDEYLMIDFCFQLHSRKREEFVYIRDSKIENAKIVFDKAGVIRYKEYNKEDFKLWNDSPLEECKYRYIQHSRVIYTPANANYYLIHISHHIPESQVKKLESFVKVSSLE